jgi:transketolase
MLNSKIFDADVEKKATREGFGEGLLEIGEKNEQVMVLSADLKESTRAEEFAKKFPNRFIECGVAEQNMMGIAAGLAAAGKIPWVASYAVFSPARNWDQLRVAVCYSNLNVKIVGAHTGISVGADGATHQAMEDIAITRVLPNMTVVVPCDAWETRKATIAGSNMVGPYYLRFTKEKTPAITTPETPFQIGKANILWDSQNFQFSITNSQSISNFSNIQNQVAIVACGPLLYQALIAAKELHVEGIGTMVVNNHTIKPMDHETISEAAKKCGAVVTVEEHQVAGGMGSAVAEVLAQNSPVPIEFIGMKDSFGESGKAGELLEKYGMSVVAIKEAVKKVIGRK